MLEHIIRKRYAALPEITSIYLAHGLALGEVYPGLSDFDLGIIFETSENREFYKKLSSPWNTFKQFFPARDVLLFTEREFGLWQNFGGGWEPLDELRHWKCIYGPDLRLSEWDLNNSQTEKDRFLYALAKYHSLLSAVIKEEPNTPYLAVAARRSLYKAFCSTVLPLDGRYLSIGNQLQRLLRWFEDNGNGNVSVVQELINMRKSRFHCGTISTLKFSLGALGYKVIDNALGNCKYSYTHLSKSIPSDEKTIHLSNLPEVEEQIRGLASGIIELLKEKLESLMLTSNGSPFGYKLLVILKDGLSFEKVEEVLRTLHVVFRVHDNSWFNEHFPAKVPVVFSKNMFQAHLLLWPFDRNYVHSHRRVLYGRDLYEEFMQNQLVTDNKGDFEEDILREKINFSRYLHQVYLERLKPALYDAVTLTFPRLYVLHKLGWAPSTAEEAIFYYEKIKDTEAVNFPEIFFKKYGNKNIDTIARTMSDDEFEEVWEFLTDGFINKSC
ncbi:MAG TPA: hypothetical protein VLB01_02560 [Thermodesulfobacteriota bacterium]|nr:hypothetical protein [Thermodesulfobacteriota bacterium]